MKACWLALCLCLAALPAQAEPFVRANGFIVNYAAISSMDLTPEIAQELGVARSPHRGLLIVNAQREEAPGRSVAVAATATGVIHGLTGSDESLHLRPSKDGDLLADFQVLDREYFTFDLQVTPAGAAQPIAVRFTQQFFVE